MRQLIVIGLSIAAILTWTGCEHLPPPPSPYSSTILPPVQDATALNVRANDLNASQEERARAIFAIFAHQLRPGASAADVRRVLANPAWVSQTHLYAADELSGWIPLELTAEDTVFAVHLFPGSSLPRQSPWVIYLRLTGKFLQYEDAVAFLKGERGNWNPKLSEYALAFPTTSGSDTSTGRVEVFSGEGIRVYGEGFKPAPSITVAPR